MYSVNVSQNPSRKEKIPAPNAQELGTLLADNKANAEFRILRAARQQLALNGLGISMDAIADEAGVGRRTIFRHFPVRDELVAQALDTSLLHFHNHVPEALEEKIPFEEWLYRVITELYSMQITAGRGLWQLAATEDQNLPAPIAAINVKRRQQRHESTQSIAQEAWSRLGKSGNVPRNIELMFALTLASFAARSLNFDYGAETQESIQAMTDMLMGYLKTV
jgi:AcrR family transcriptional regulator